MVEPSKNSPKISRIPSGIIPIVFNELSKALSINGEPMYDLNEKNLDALYALADLPFVSWNGTEKYQTIEEKAAAILCLTTRGHKFGNGNKRTAVILLLLLLFCNDKWLSFSWKDLYKLSMDVASEADTDTDTQIIKISRIIAENIIDLPTV